MKQSETRASRPVEFVVLSETEQGLSGSSLVHLKTIWNVLGLLFSFCYCGSFVDLLWSLVFLFAMAVHDFGSRVQLEFVAEDFFSNPPLVRVVHRVA